MLTVAITNAQYSKIFKKLLGDFWEVGNILRNLYQEQGKYGEKFREARSNQEISQKKSRNIP